VAKFVKDMDKKQTTFTYGGQTKWFPPATDWELKCYEGEEPVFVSLH